MKKIIISLLGLGILGLANANEKTGDLKSSATIQATCLISANQIGFGVVASPLMSQSAQSEMSVKCSNASAYTIDLAYGGIYGTGANSSHNISFSSYGGSYNTYMVYNKDGLAAGSITCGFGSSAGKVMFSNSAIAQLYGTPYIGGFQNNTNKACISNNTREGTYPTGWSGSYNTPGRQPISGNLAYSYGVMSGMSKGDKLAYSIQVPNEPNKVWNSGNNSFQSIGNGDNQTIPVVAKIEPDKSGSKYIAPDMYIDTITAIIAY